MSVEDGEFLRERAEQFRELAEELLEKGTLDLAAFHFQQAVELRLKYELFLEVGDYPQTHGLKRLFDDYGRAADRVEASEHFLDDHIDVVSNLENAYITARYLPGDFREREVQNMEEVVDDVWQFLDEETS